MTRPSVWFFVPTHEVSAAEFPDSVESYGEWIRGRREIDAWGPYDWTLQTYLHLARAGVRCELTHEIPSDGIVVAHRDFFAEDLRPGSRLLLVCIIADREEPGLNGRQPYAQVSLVQNPRDAMLVHPDPLWEAAFMPFWTQPGLLGRDPARGTSFVNAAYFGKRKNLAPQLRESRWQKHLSDLGLRWRTVPRNQWHDYREVDVVIAVRSFSGRNFRYKPATKLFQSWHAGVPCVLGRESAYAAERRHALDYLEVATFDEAIDALRSLRDDPVLRQAMVDNGRRRAMESTPERMVERWSAFLDQVAAPAWSRWRALSDHERQHFLEERASVLRR